MAGQNNFLCLFGLAVATGSISGYLHYSALFLFWQIINNLYMQQF